MLAESPRKIIHVDMDAFFASIEQRDNPELRGKPIAVGGDGERGVVAAASYEARKFGVHSALSSKIAKQRCPHLIFVRHRFDVYKSVSRQVMDIFRSYTDLVEPLSLDEAYLDVTRNKKGIETATEVAENIRADIFAETQLTASAGVSVSKFLAKVASDVNKPNGLTVIKPHRVQEFIDALDIEKVPGIGKVTAAKMKKMGIFTCADLKSRELSELTRRFGKAGRYFHNISHGIDNREVKTDRIRKSLGAERTFEQDLYDRKEVEAKLSMIAEEVARRIDKAKKKGKTITLKIKFNDFNTITRSKSYDHFIDKEREIMEAAIALIPPHSELKKGIRLLGITVSTFESDSQPVEIGGQLTLDL